MNTWELVILHPLCDVCFSNQGRRGRGCKALEHNRPLGLTNASPSLTPNLRLEMPTTIVYHAVDDVVYRFVYYRVTDNNSWTCQRRLRCAVQGFCLSSVAKVVVVWWWLAALAWRRVSRSCCPLDTCKDGLESSFNDSRRGHRGHLNFTYRLATPGPLLTVLSVL